MSLSSWPAVSYQCHWNRCLSLVSTFHGQCRAVSVSLGVCLCYPCSQAVLAYRVSVSPCPRVFDFLSWYARFTYSVGISGCLCLHVPVSLSSCPGIHISWVVSASRGVYLSLSQCLCLAVLVSTFHGQCRRFRVSVPPCLSVSVLLS